MPVSERTVKALEALGLSSYQVKAYAALLEGGPAKALEVSRGAGIPYSKVYEVLAGLEQKGWVESDDGRPSRYYPKPPQVALEALKMKVESEMREHETMVLGELVPLYERREVRERPEIWIVRGDYNILSEVKEVVLGCQRELMVAVPSLTPMLIDVFAPTLAGLKERGVSIMIMVAEEGHGERLRRLTRYAEVRVKEDLYGGGVIADGSRVILLLGEGREPGRHIAIWAEHPGLARIAKEYFESLWSASKPLKAA